LPKCPAIALIDIVSGPPLAPSLIAPRLVAPQTPFDVVVRLDDLWGNTCRDLAHARRATPDRSCRRRATTAAGLLGRRGWSVARVSGVRLAKEGEWRLEASVDGISAPTAVAFVQVESLGQALRPLYADLHVHSHDTVGTNDTLYNLSYGRDVAGLDVVGYTVNDFNIKQAHWEQAVEIIARSERTRSLRLLSRVPSGAATRAPGATATSYSWATASRAFLSMPRVVRCVRSNGTTPPPARSVPGYGRSMNSTRLMPTNPEHHLLIPHVGGRRCILDWHHPELERLVEIGSSWGQFHWFYTDALRAVIGSVRPPQVMNIRGAAAVVHRRRPFSARAVD
jgi:hypothetical protein